MGYLDLDLARRHTRSQGVPDDDDLRLKMAQAEAIVLQHIKYAASPEWDETSDPETDRDFAIIQAATLKVLGNLYRFRGDDEKPGNPLSEDVILMLSQHRDPSLA
jgi:hypothetical protein